MADSPRIDELQRRVRDDPASIAFAQLAEEYRRAGRLTDAVEASRAGLAHHPGYASARVTLGRAHLEQGDLDAAEAAFRPVLDQAPLNLAAIRGLADVLRRRGLYAEALAGYRAAATLAPNDPDIDATVEALRRHIEERSRRTIAALERWLAALAPVTL